MYPQYYNKAKYLALPSQHETLPSQHETLPSQHEVLPRQHAQKASERGDVFRIAAAAASLQLPPGGAT